eukprot:266010-Hanusia_phi.AAC.1
MQHSITLAPPGSATVGVGPGVKTASRRPPAHRVRESGARPELSCPRRPLKPSARPGLGTEFGKRYGNKRVHSEVGPAPVGYRRTVTETVGLCTVSLAVRSRSTPVVPRRSPAARTGGPRRRR